MELETFVKKGQAAQAAVDQVVRRTIGGGQLRIEAPGVPSPFELSADKTAEKLELKRQLDALNAEAARIRRMMAKLESEATRLQEEGVLARDQPLLGVDQATREIAQAVLPGPPIALPVLTQAEAQALDEPPAPPPPGPDIKPSTLYEIGDFGPRGPELAEQLEAAMEGLRIMPAAPEFQTEGTGRIGKPIELEPRKRWAVVRCKNWRLPRSGIPMATYALQRLHSAVEDWAEPVQTHLQRWGESPSGVPPENVPLTGVLVQDPDGKEWVLGRDYERIQISVPRDIDDQPPAEAPAPAIEHPELYPQDKADDEGYAREWYGRWAVAMGGGAPLTGARLDTLMELPCWCRHLMLDPRLNDYGVRANPDRKRIHTIPKTVGQAEVLLYEDIDGKWWRTSNFAIRSSVRGGGLPGPRPGSVPGDRSDSAYDALLGELASLLTTAIDRASGVGSDTEARMAARFADAVTKFRGEAHALFNKSTATVTHKPGKLDFARRRAGALCKLLHPETPPKTQPVAGKRKAAPQPAKPARPSLSKAAAKARQHRKGKPSAATLTLGQFVAGIKGGLPKAMHARIQYDKQLNSASAEVLRLHASQTSVRDAIKQLKEQWA